MYISRGGIVCDRYISRLFRCKDLLFTLWYHSAIQFVAVNGRTSKCKLCTLDFKGKCFLIEACHMHAHYNALVSISTCTVPVKCLLAHLKWCAQQQY